MQRVFEPKVRDAEDAKITASRRASAVSGTSSARYYANRTRSLRSLERPRNFGQRLSKSGRTMDPKEMRRFSSVQVNF
jgi:H+-transporting ATPase